MKSPVTFSVPRAIVIEPEFPPKRVALNVAPSMVIVPSLDHVVSESVREMESVSP